MDNSIENFDKIFGNCFGIDDMNLCLNIDFIENMVREIPADEVLQTTDHLIDEVFGCITNEVNQSEDRSITSFQSERELFNESSICAYSNEFFPVPLTMALKPHPSNKNVVAVDEYFNSIKTDYSYSSSDMKELNSLTSLPGKVLEPKLCYVYSTIGEPAGSYIIQSNQTCYQPKVITQKSIQRATNERSNKNAAIVPELVTFYQERPNTHPPTSYRMTKNSKPNPTIGKLKRLTGSPQLKAKIQKQKFTKQQANVITSANKCKCSTAYTSEPNVKGINSNIISA